MNLEAEQLKAIYRHLRSTTLTVLKFPNGSVEYKMTEQQALAMAEEIFRGIKALEPSRG